MELEGAGVAVGFFNPPPIDGRVLVSAGLLPPLDELSLLPLGEVAPLPLEESNPFLADGTPSFDYTLPYLFLVGFGVDTVDVLVLVDAAVVGLVPIDVFEPISLEFAGAAFSFYKVSTNPYNLLISSLTFSIYTFIYASTLVFTVLSIIFIIESLRSSGNYLMASSNFYYSSAD